MAIIQRTDDVISTSEVMVEVDIFISLPHKGKGVKINAEGVPKRNVRESEVWPEQILQPIKFLGKGTECGDSPYNPSYLGGRERRIAI
jgi:hypothetical protein